MIGKICPRGQDLAGLIRYLYGPGRREEHTDPHVIAGYRPPSDLEPPLRANGSRDFRRLVGLFRLPHDVLGKWGYARPVWHCSMRAAPEDRLLSDADWADVARDVMHRTGLCPRGEEDEAVRWIAIRHGPDHIHLVAMLARQDRTRPRIVNERYRVRDACIAAEQRYRLRSTAPADRTAARPPSRAETGKAARHGRSEPPRTTLRRHVATAAAAASSATEFFARLDQAGILVRLRYSVTNPRPGHGVRRRAARRQHQERGTRLVRRRQARRRPVLAQTRPAVDRPARPDPPLTAAEADALWDYAARTTADATDRIRYCTAAGNPAAAADAAYAASDALHVAAAALGSRALRLAADSFERAARQPHGRIPAPTPAGNQLRHAARLIAAYAYLTQEHWLTPIVLLVRLAALAEAVAELRDSQQRAAQAAAALRAAQHLRTATRPAPPDTPAARQASHGHPAPRSETRPSPARQSRRNRPAVGERVVAGTARRSAGASFRRPAGPRVPIEVGAREAEPGPVLAQAPGHGVAGSADRAGGR